MNNVTKLNPVECGEDFRFDADEVLELAKGHGYVTVSIIGQTEDGEIFVSGNANAGESIILLERAKHFLVFGSE